MADAVEVDPVIARMPRGGPTASWLDRQLQTDVLEYTDRYDIPDDVKQLFLPCCAHRVVSKTYLHNGDANATGRVLQAILDRTPAPR